jgi:MFS family permease
MLVWCGMYYAFPALFAKWEAAFGWSKPELTGAITVSLLASALTAPFVGRLIDDGHGPAVLTASAAAGGILMIALSFVGELWQFYIVWAGLGVAMGGALYEPCFSFLTWARGREAVRAITTVSLFAGFAGTLSFPLGHVMSEIGGWRLAAVVYGASMLVIAVPLMWTATRALQRERPATPPPAAGETPPARNAHLRKPAFWLLAIGFTLLILNHGVILNHILPLLHERGFSDGTAVLTASTIGPMQVAGRIAMMLAQRRVSITAIMLACFAGIATATVLLIGSAAIPALLVGFVVLQGASHGVTSIVRPAITREVMGEKNFGAIAGAMAVPYLIGVALAPFLGSLIWLVGGYDLVLPVILVSAIAGGVSCFIATRQPRSI